MTRLARYALLPCAAIALVLAACVAPPAIDAPPPGAASSRAKINEESDATEPLVSTGAEVWLGILLVAGLLGAGASFLTSRRSAGR